MGNRHGGRGQVLRRIALAAGLASLLIAAAPVTGSPAKAAFVSMSRAEKLWRLDVMLKAADRRCRRTPDAFAADYAAFVANHRHALGRAERELAMELAYRDRGTAAGAALDRLSAAMSREYAAGHPWLDCRQLKSVTHGLVSVVGSAVLLEAADQVVPQGEGRHVAALSLPNGDGI